MKFRLKLLDPAPTDGNGSATVPPVATPGGNPVIATKTGTGFNPPQDDDNFLDDTKPPEPAEPIVPEPAKEVVVVDPVKPATGGYTPEQVAELIKSVGKPVLPEPVAKQMTPEEIDAKLNTYNPTEVDINELLEGGPKALSAMKRIATALVKNAVTVASVLADDKLRQQMSSLQPHIDFAQAQQQRFAQEQYFTDNPTHIGLEPLVAQVAQQMQQEGFKGTPQTTFKEVGKRVDALVAKLKIPITKPGETVVAAETVKPAATRMSTVSTGGQGGAGGADTSKGKDPEADIWK